MNSKERLLTTLEHKEPDRVPLDLGGWVTTISVKTYQRLLSYLKIDRDAQVFDWLRQNVSPEEDVLQRLGVDTRYVHLGKPHFWNFKPNSTPDGMWVRDEWGCGFLMPESSLYYNLMDSPLRNATIDDLDNYSWPDPNDKGFLDGVEAQAKALAEDGQFGVVGNFAWESWFERAWKLRGMDTFFMDMVINKEFVHALLDKTLSIHMTLLDNVLEVCGKHLDVIIQGGDLGGQKNTLMSLNAYREYIKPRQEKSIRLIKEKTKAKVFWHSCGAISNLIDDFIEVGIDILNPVQVSSTGMDILELKKKYGENIVFWGGIDSQNILPYGSTQDVEAAVKGTFKSAGANGGLVMCAVHNIQADVPEENVLALYDAARKFGQYSISSTQ